MEIKADIVIVGGGAAGLTAAVTAAERGCTVALLEANYDLGGAAILSAGAMLIGGGHSVQGEFDVTDSPDRVWTDWTTHRHLQGRYNDRDLVRTFADASVETVEFLRASGVDFETLPPRRGLDSVAARPQAREWHDPAGIVIKGQNGSGLTRALERRARELGVRFLLQHRMRKLLADGERRVTGVEADLVDRDFNPTGAIVTVIAYRAVLLATGGITGDVAFRSLFDPRLTAEYQQVGQSWSLRRADGHRAALALGAAICGTASQTNEASAQLSKGRMGTRDNYHRIGFTPESSCFFRAKATGHLIRDWSNAILVKENGGRFYREDVDDRDYDYLNAAMAWNGNPDKLNGGGVIWAILDADGLRREGVEPRPPSVDTDGYFFQADSLEELATLTSRNPFQGMRMDGRALMETVERYNAAVRAGHDREFGKTALDHQIVTAPFYAAWHTPVCHDTYVGLRTDLEGRVRDFSGEVIPGLFAAGEVQGGFGQHGLGRAIVFGRLAACAATT